MGMPNEEENTGKKYKPPKTDHQKLADQDKKFQKRLKELQKQKEIIMQHKVMKDKESKGYQAYKEKLKENDAIKEEIQEK